MKEQKCCGSESGGAATGNVEQEVLRRYKAGANAAEAKLCCPIDYDTQYLKALPKEVIEKDYGCGDPSVYVGAGERVVDLGSGSGKICYILSQKVGPEGHVIGVDFNEAMLALSRKYIEPMREKLGYGNVEFRAGKIQDLALNLDRVQEWMNAHPIQSVEDLSALEEECARLRREEPLVADGEADAVVSNCVLNLVRPEDKTQLFHEIHRVLRKGGRAVISDIVCDEEPTQAIMDDPELWSGCISGTFLEAGFLERFEEAGFYGIEVLKRQEEPWQVIDGIEFRSMTVRAFCGKEGPCLERNQAAVYRGPWKSVTDDDGHILLRGERSAVCDKTFGILTDPNGPYAGSVEGIPPHDEVALDAAKPYDCTRPDLRDPKETKGQGYRLTTQAEASACCCASEATPDAGELQQDAFDAHIASASGEDLTSCCIETVQVNLGLLCNMSCSHCHVEASPQRTEIMEWPTMEAILGLLDEAPCKTVDLTGGAPELNPHFRDFVKALRERDLPVQVRTNLTVLLEPGMEDLPEFFRDLGVGLIASMPCYLEENVRAQRGAGAYEGSIEILRRLNALGYGQDPSLVLSLVYNPAEAVLPPEQRELEAQYRREFESRFGIQFTNLLTITNAPLGRFGSDLRAHGREGDYLRLLRDAFNPDTIDRLMCRRQISIGWDGTLYDCDFNLALGLPVDHGAPNHISGFESDALTRRRIVTGNHCFACTAGSGSSCQGALSGDRP